MTSHSLTFTFQRVDSEPSLLLRHPSVKNHDTTNVWYIADKRTYGGTWGWCALCFYFAVGSGIRAVNVWSVPGSTFRVPGSSRSVQWPYTSLHRPPRWSQGPVLWPEKMLKMWLKVKAMFFRARMREAQLKLSGYLSWQKFSRCEHKPTVVQIARGRENIHTHTPILMCWYI